MGYDVDTFGRVNDYDSFSSSFLSVRENDATAVSVDAYTEVFRA